MILDISPSHLVELRTSGYIHMTLSNYTTLGINGLYHMYLQFNMWKLSNHMYTKYNKFSTKIEDVYLQIAQLDRIEYINFCNKEKNKKL